MTDKLKIMLFPAGITAAFRNGEQVPELQESWFLLYVQLVAACGIDPCEVEFTMPDGGQAMVFETEEGRYNWQRS